MSYGVLRMMENMSYAIENRGEFEKKIKKRMGWLTAYKFRFVSGQNPFELNFRISSIYYKHRNIQISVLVQSHCFEMIKVIDDKLDHESYKGYNKDDDGILEFINDIKTIFH